MIAPNANSLDENLKRHALVIRNRYPLIHPLWISLKLLKSCPLLLILAALMKSHSVRKRFNIFLDFWLDIYGLIM